MRFFRNSRLIRQGLGLALISLYVSLTAYNTQAGNSVSATASVNATVQQQISVTNQDNLDFGTLQSLSSGGTIAINPATNARTSSSGITVSGDYSRGKALVQGSTNTEYNVFPVFEELYFISEETQNDLGSRPNDLDDPEDCRDNSFVANAAQQERFDIVQYCFSYNSNVEDGVNRLKVNTIRISGSNNNNNIGNTQQTDSSGNDTIHFGATLHVTENTEQNSSYSGNIELTVSY